MSSDPTLNHEAVKAYRDQFRFCPKIGFREDIISTVKDMDLWKTILANWGYFKGEKWIKHNPLNVKGMMSEYERRATNERNGQARTSQRNVERVSALQTGTARVPERSDGRMLHLREGTGLFLRRGSETLEETLTKALRTNNRS